MHPSKRASLSLCVCVYAFVKCVCMHLYIILCVVHSQRYIAAVLDWYGPEADPVYWQTGREEVTGLQVACEAHNLHVGEGIPQNIRSSYTDHFSIIIINYCIFSVGSHCQDIDAFYLLSIPKSLSCMCNSCALV